MCEVSIIDHKSTSATGRLLVATPPMDDPNFLRSVVLILQHDAQGAFGLVINQPADGVRTEAHELLAPWLDHSTLPAVFFGGGPVDTNSIIGLGRFANSDERSWTTHLGDGLYSIDLDSDATNASDCVQLRLFIGYCGWSPMQLDEEIASEQWFVLDALPHDPFTSDPETLWRRVLEREPTHRAWVSKFPVDPSLN